MSSIYISMVHKWNIQQANKSEERGISELDFLMACSGKGKLVSWTNRHLSQKGRYDHKWISFLNTIRRWSFLQEDFAKLQESIVKGHVLASKRMDLQMQNLK
jgi:hypothetical protein